MPKPLHLELDRSAKTPLAEQIRKGISDRDRERRARAGRASAVLAGPRGPARRRPRHRALGLRKAVRRPAHRRLARDRNPCRGPASRRRSARASRPIPARSWRCTRSCTAGPAIFQMGVPAREAFPAKLLARIRSSAVRAEASAPPLYPDPRGELELRREIAAYLAIARGIECSPSQIIVTGGFSSGLGLALRVLGLEGRKAWMEEPGFPFTRRGLELARLSLAPIPVDADGIDVDYGLRPCSGCGAGRRDPGAAGAARVYAVAGTATCACSTGPLRKGAWVIEDDYLSELQLQGASSAGARLARSRRAGHSHRLLQQDHQPRLASRLSRRSRWRWRPGSPRSRRVSRRRPGRRCSLRPRSSCATATICAISGAPSGSTPPSATPCWNAFGRAPRTSRSRDWLCCCDCRTACRTYPSPGRRWRSDWRLHRCRLVCIAGFRRDPACCWASPPHRKSILGHPATGSFGSLIAPGDERRYRGIVVRRGACRRVDGTRFKAVTMHAWWLAQRPQ